MWIVLQAPEDDLADNDGERARPQLPRGFNTGYGGDIQICRLLYAVYAVELQRNCDGLLT
jgi:hypothetical protein